jgi:hypothetical protein
MSLTVADAYAQIKNLENTGEIIVPEPLDTVVVGTIDPALGTFTWSLPTVVQTLVVPPLGDQKTNTITNLTVGVVATQAVDLRLKFAVIPLPPVSLSVAAAAAVPATGPAAPAISAAAPRVAARGDAAAPAPAPAGAGSAPVADLRVSGFGPVVLGSNGGVTIDGFPTVISIANEVTVDAGLACSAVIDDPYLVPPVTRFGLTINMPGHDPISIDIFVLRPPVLGMGVFTLPALPMAIVYAPPQGKQAMNSVSYQDLASYTRNVTTSMATSTTTKVAEAYSIGDLVGKVTAAVAMVVAVVGTGGAGAAEGASVAGALSQLGAALFGPAKDANDATADATSQLGATATLVAGILGALDSSASTTASGAITTQDDHTLSLTVSDMSQFQSEAARGPGAGDRIIYMQNVRVVWMAVNGDVGIHILGCEGIGANAVDNLLAEEANLAAGGSPTLGLDAATIASLLSQDPLVPGRRGVLGDVAVRVGPAVISPPRFVPAVPPGRTGTGTGTGGDVFAVGSDVTVDAMQTQTSSHTQVTDIKPGWADVLFGASDNTETTTTVVLTNTTSTDTKTEDKITSTFTFFSEGANDRYNVKIFKDLTFGTYAVLDADSPLLQGSSTGSVVGGLAR